ncbi:MAG TPA: flagellin [Phycisphaerales bacterium]|nr:flagellin [Phycisphaerales bacterium]
MSSIPSNLGRVPDLLRSQLALANITRTNADLFRISNQVASGKAINRPSDDAVKSVAIAAINSRLHRSAQIGGNLELAGSALATLDQALGEAGDLLLQAQSIASEQANFGASSGERESEAVVIESIIQGLFEIANRESRVGHIFGGSVPGLPPMEAFRNGYRYTGRGPGLTTDLDFGGAIPVTLGGTTLLGSTSSRVRGTADLDPDLTADTRLADLDGARGIGVERGVVTFSFAGAEPQEVDLSEAETIDDVIDRLSAAISAYGAEQGVTILGPDGISFSGKAFTVDVDGGGGADARLRFGDVGTGTMAMDLGLADEDGLEFSGSSGAGLDVAPRLSWATPLSALEGVGGAGLGQIRLRAHGQTRIVDLSGAETLQDIRNLIEASGLGVRVEINGAGTGIDVLSEVATSGEAALAIEEVPGNGGTAAALGIRSLDATTRLEEFNDGRGVRIVSGALDPDTGDPDPTLDVDFTITLGNGAAIDINLSPADVTTVQGVLDAINSQAADRLTELGLPTTLFQAGLADGENGIVLTQDDSGAGMTDDLRIEPRNNSQAAADLGLLGGELSADGSTLHGEDRAKIRPANVFSWLIDLRNALQNDDTAGIALAGEKVGAAVDALAETRALVGGYASRVEKETTALEERNVLDQSVLSHLQDADFAQAASRLALLQTQLQAGLQTTAMATSLSLMDFLA